MAPHRTGPRRSRGRRGHQSQHRHAHLGIARHGHASHVVPSRGNSAHGNASLFEATRNLCTGPGRLERAFGAPFPGCADLRSAKPATASQFVPWQRFATRLGRITDLRNPAPTSSKQRCASPCFARLINASHGEPSQGTANPLHRPSPLERETRAPFRRTAVPCGASLSHSLQPFAFQTYANLRRTDAPHRHADRRVPRPSESTHPLASALVAREGDQGTTFTASRRVPLHRTAQPTKAIPFEPYQRRAARDVAAQRGPSRIVSKHRPCPTERSGRAPRRRIAPLAIATRTLAVPSIVSQREPWHRGSNRDEPLPRPATHRLSRQRGASHAFAEHRFFYGLTNPLKLSTHPRRISIRKSGPLR